MTHTETPAIGTPVVILAGAPYEVTWDDSGDDAIGVEGILNAIDPDYPAPFEVRTADGRTLHAQKVRVIDDTYRAEKSAQQAVDDRVALRRLALLLDGLLALVEDPELPTWVRDRLLQADQETANQAWQEGDRAAGGATPAPSWDAGMESLRARLGRRPA